MHDGREDPLCEQLTHGQPTSSADECLPSADSSSCDMKKVEPAPKEDKKGVEPASSCDLKEEDPAARATRENRDGSGSSGPRSKTTDSSSWSWQWEEPPKEEEVQA